MYKCGSHLMPKAASVVSQITLSQGVMPRGLEDEWPAERSVPC
jgi:hypothetical protein